jgi:hypothetical protein
MEPIKQAKTANVKIIFTSLPNNLTVVGIDDFLPIAWNDKAFRSPKIPRRRFPNVSNGQADIGRGATLEISQTRCVWSTAAI